MHEVQNQLHFKIDTPSDSELAKMYADASVYGTGCMLGGKHVPIQEIALPATTRNQKKRARRKARGKV